MFSRFLLNRSVAPGATLMVVQRKMPSGGRLRVVSLLEMSETLWPGEEAAQKVVGPVAVMVGISASTVTGSGDEIEGQGAPA